MPEDAIVENFDRMEEALRAEVNELVDSFGVADKENPDKVRVELASVPKTRARMLARSMFACIEAIVYAMKQVALSVDRLQNTLTVPEVVLCQEKSFDLTDKGEGQTRAAKLRFKPNLRFAFSVLAKTLKVPFSLNTNCEGWNSLVRSVKVRDRLTHPKQPSDLELTNDELEQLFNGYQWFNSQVSALFGPWTQRAEEFKAYADAIRDHAAARKQAGDSKQADPAG